MDDPIAAPLIAETPISERHPKTRPRPPDAPIYLVINGASGKASPGVAQSAMTQALQQAAREFRVFLAEDPRDLDQIAKAAVMEAKACNGHVVVAGGDGTINTVANYAYHADCTLGVIPLGTFNYTGRTYGIPLEPGRAMNSLLDAEPIQVQVGLVNDRVFLVNAGMGFHSHLLRQREKHKAKLGRSQLVALASALLSLLDLPKRLTLNIELGRTRTTKSVTALFVGNNALQLQQTGLLDADALPESRLMGVAVDPATPLQMFAMGCRAALARLRSDEHIHDFPFREMTVSRPKHNSAPLRVALDGELVFMKGPIRFCVAPRPLRLLLPRETE